MKHKTLGKFLASALSFAMVLTALPVMNANAEQTVYVSGDTIYQTDLARGVSQSNTYVVRLSRTFTDAEWQEMDLENTDTLITAANGKFTVDYVVDEAKSSESVETKTVDIFFNVTVTYPGMTENGTDTIVIYADSGSRVSTPESLSVSDTQVTGRTEAALSYSYNNTCTTTGTITYSAGVWVDENDDTVEDLGDWGISNVSNAKEGDIITVTGYQEASEAAGTSEVLGTAVATAPRDTVGTLSYNASNVCGWEASWTSQNETAASFTYSSADGKWTCDQNSTGYTTAEMASVFGITDIQNAFNGDKITITRTPAVYDFTRGNDRYDAGYDFVIATVNVNYALKYTSPADTLSGVSRTSDSTYHYVVGLNKSDNSAFTTEEVNKVTGTSGSSYFTITPISKSLSGDSKTLNITYDLTVKAGEDDTSSFYAFYIDNDGDGCYSDSNDTMLCTKNIEITRVEDSTPSYEAATSSVITEIAQDKPVLMTNVTSNVIDATTGAEIEVTGSTARVVFPTKFQEYLRGLKSGSTVTLDMTSEDRLIDTISINETFYSLYFVEKKALVIKTKTYTLELDQKAVQSLCAGGGKDGGKDVVLKLNNLESTLALNSKQQAALEGQNVVSTIQVSAYCGDTNVSSFKGGKVKVTLTGETVANNQTKKNNYLNVGEAKHLMTYYVSDSGQKELMSTVYDYSNGNLSFTTGHFSTYCIVYDPNLTNDTKDLGTYTIQKGDCLWSIARKLGMNFARLVELNGDIAKQRYIYAGQKLNIEK